MKKLKTPGIRVGDTVTITRPDFFVRCGYPMDFRTEVKKIETERADEIVAFLRSMGAKLDGFWGELQREHYAIQKVAKAIAYELCKDAGFGGRTRKIYTETLADCLGSECAVTDVRFVKTGEYSSGGYHSEDGPDPPYLANEKTHRILSLNVYGQLSSMEWEDHLRIDAENVCVLAKAVAGKERAA